MKEQQRLPNPPIKEAVIDIRVAPQERYDLARFDEQYVNFQESYPDTEQVNEGVFRLTLPKIEEQHRRIGVKYSSKDGKYVCQFRENGFTISRLAPYEKWETMFEEARRLWSYFKAARPSEQIVRVATRYINVINIPLPMRDFGDWLESPPIIPEELPQGVSSFLNRVTIENPDISAVALVTQAMEQPTQAHVPVTLDIDVFATQALSIDGDSQWEILETLRNFKNDIFFEYLTPDALRLFK